MVRRSVTSKEDNSVFCIHFCRLLPIGLFIFLVFMVSKSAENTGNEIVNIRQNWERAPYTKLSSSMVGNSQRIFVGEWPGIDSGCDCTNIGFCYRRGVSMGSLQKGTCSRNESLCGCVDVAQRPKKELIIFPNEAEFFGETDSDLAFSKIYKNMELSGKCKQGFKRCGEDKAPFFGVCIPDGKNCPITDIKLASTNPDPSTYSNEVKGKILNIYYTNKNIKEPITELTVSEYKMCTDLSISLTPGRPAYPLMKKVPSDCPEDTRYEDLKQTTGEKTYFDINHVNYHNLNRYSPSDSYIYKKFARGLIKIRPDCQNLIPEIMSENAAHIKLNSSLWGLKFTGFVLLAIFGIQFIAILCADSKSKSSTFKKIVIFNGILYIILTCFFLILTVRTMLLMRSSHQWIKNITTCFESFTNSRLKVASQSYSGGIFYSLFSGFFIFALIIILDLFFIGKFLKKFGEEKREDSGVVCDIEGNRNSSPFLGNGHDFNLQNNGGYNHQGGYNHNPYGRNNENPF